MKDAYDCIVVGGGPAGSTAAALVAQAGFSTLVLEREKVPRFHVGESLMPETYWIFQRLGVLKKMQQSDFVRKVSVQFVSHRGSASQPFYFREHDPRPCSQTWQVERAAFDKMLLDNAAEKGAQWRDQTRVLDPVMHQGRVAGVVAELPDGTRQQLRAKVVVDATGQQALLANRFNLRRDDPQLRKAAIWAYFRGARRQPGEHGGATVILHTRAKRSWFWFIPLRGDITSIGVVADRDDLLKGRGKPEEVFRQELEQCPSLQERLQGAAATSRMRVAREFSYTTTRHAGDGWVLVGDAFGFIDPIYSSGVYFAMKSAEMAADAIVEGLQRGDVSAAQLGCWTDRFEHGTRWIRKLVDAFYCDTFSFGRFLRRFPHHRGNLTDLLIGRIFGPDAGRLFDDLDPLLAAGESPATGDRPAGVDAPHRAR